MLVERSMTKTASGSGIWKRRGHAMLTTRISAVLFAGTLATGHAFAAPAASPSPPQAKAASASRQAPLPPGPAAQVREAQGVGRPLLYWAGAGALLIAGVILIAQDDDGSSTTAATSTGN